MTDPKADQIASETFLRASAIRGVNISAFSKGAMDDSLNPLDPLPPINTAFTPFGDGLDTDACLDCVRRISATSVRLMVFHEALEPRRGRLNMQYIRGLITTIRKCTARGISVLLDFHQDLYSRLLGGSGMAHHMLPTRVQEGLKDSPLVIGGSNWALRYFYDRRQYSVWASFWDDEEGIQSHYIQYIAAVLGELTAAGCQLIGVDIMNEPALPEIFLHSLTFRPFRVARRRRQLAAFYAAAVQACETAFNRSQRGQEPPMYFIEPFNIDVSRIGLLHAGMSPIPLPPLLLARCVFAAHLYHPSRLCPGPHAMLKAHYKEAAVAGCAALVVGEFGDLGRGPALVEEQAAAMGREVCGFYFYEFNPQSGRVWNDESMSCVDDTLTPTAVMSVVAPHMGTSILTDTDTGSLSSHRILLPPSLAMDPQCPLRSLRNTFVSGISRLAGRGEDIRVLPVRAGSAHLKVLGGRHSAAAVVSVGGLSLLLYVGPAVPGSYRATVCKRLLVVREEHGRRHRRTDLVLSRKGSVALLEGEGVGIGAM